MDLEMPPDVVVSKPKEPSLWSVGGHKGVVHWQKVYGLVLLGVRLILRILGGFWKIMGGMGFYLREKGVCLEKKVYFCRLITVHN